MSKMRMKNARNPEQLRRMKKLKESKLCYFCMQGSEKEKTLPKIIYKEKYWYITKNDFPIEGSIHHYLIVPKRHIKKESEVSKTEWIELQKMIIWIEKHTKAKGFSKYSRNGDLAYTSATIDHLHIHFISGEKDNGKREKMKVTLGYKRSQ